MTYIGPDRRRADRRADPDGWKTLSRYEQRAQTRQRTRRQEAASGIIVNMSAQDMETLVKCWEAIEARKNFNEEMQRRCP